MNSIRLLLLISLFSSKGFVLFSQSTSETESFDYNSSDKISFLLASSCPALEYEFDNSGTFYAFDDDFSLGTVVFDGMVFRNVLINLNSHLDELCLKRDTSDIVILEKSRISSFEMNGDIFINLQEGYTSKSPNFSFGFYRVLWNGGDDRIVFLEKISKKYKEEFDKSSRHMEPDHLKREFVGVYDFYVLRDSVVFSLERPYDLCEIFGMSKKKLRQLLKKHNYRLSNSDPDCYKFIFSCLCD